MGVGGVFGVTDQDGGEVVGKGKGESGFRKSIEGIEEEARIKVDFAIGGNFGLDDRVVFTKFVGNGFNREEVGGFGFADDGAAHGAGEKSGKFGDADEFFAIQGNLDVIIFRDEFAIIWEAGVSEFRDNFDFTEAEAYQIFGKSDFDGVHVIGDGAQDLLERGGGHDGLDLGFDLIDEDFFGETVTVSGGDGQLLILSVEIDTGEGWARKIVGAGDNNGVNTNLEFVDVHFIGDGGFFDDFGQFREVVSRGAVDGGRIISGRNGNFGVAGARGGGSFDGDFFTTWKIADEFGEKFGWDGDDAIFRAGNWKKITNGHVEVGGD